MSLDPQTAMLVFYNLKKDPFTIQDAYSPVGKRYELLEQLIHLNQFGHMALGVLAPEGYGKTTLFKMLARQLQMQTDMQVVTFSPDEPKAGLDLLQQLAVAWHLDDISSDKQQLLRQLRSHNLAHSAMGLKHSILIDNAEKLGQDGLYTLHELVSGLPEEQAIGLTLFCREGKVDLRTIYKPAESLHLIHMQALSNKDVFGFIQDHFIAAGHKQGIPFPAEVIEKLYIASEGIPSEVKRLTREYMLAQAGEVSGEVKGSVPKLHILSISALVLVILGSLLFQILNTETPESVAPPLAIDTAVTLTPNSVKDRLNSAVAEVEARQQDQSETESQNAGDVIEIPVAVSKPVPIASKVVLPIGAVEIEAEVPIEVVAVEPTSAESLEAVAEDERAVELATEAAVTQNTFASLEAPSWLDQVEGTSFTIQLLGARTEKAVKQFIDNQLRPDSFRYHKIQHQGADWFIVTYGLFAEKPRAVEAIALMPDSLKKQNPWIRSIQSIRDGRP